MFSVFRSSGFGGFCGWRVVSRGRGERSEVKKRFGLGYFKICSVWEGFDIYLEGVEIYWKFLSKGEI